MSKEKQKEKMGIWNWVRTGRFWLFCALCALLGGSIGMWWANIDTTIALSTRIQALERRFGTNEIISIDTTTCGWTILCGNAAKLMTDFEVEDIGDGLRIKHVVSPPVPLTDKIWVAQVYLDSLEKLDIVQKRPGRIKKLKNNLAEFYSLPEEEKWILREVGFKNCVTLNYDGSWGRALEKDYNPSYMCNVLFPDSSTIYRISPDYEDTNSIGE